MKCVTVTVTTSPLWCQRRNFMRNLSAPSSFRDLREKSVNYWPSQVSSWYFLYLFLYLSQNEALANTILIARLLQCILVSPPSQLCIFVFSIVNITTMGLPVLRVRRPRPSSRRYLATLSYCPMYACTFHVGTQISLVLCWYDSICPSNMGEMENSAILERFISSKWWPWEADGRLLILVFLSFWELRF